MSAIQERSEKRKGCVLVGGFQLFAGFVVVIFIVSLAMAILSHRVDKKRDKLERKVLDSQERAFWDVHRPVVSRPLFLVDYTHQSL